MSRYYGIMNQGDQNINKDMFDSDLIDVESLDYSDDQTWWVLLKSIYVREYVAVTGGDYLRGHACLVSGRNVSLSVECRVSLDI